MGKNKKENLTFTLLMCFTMVLVMSLYNTILNRDGTSDLLKSYVSGFLPTLVVAILWELLVVVRNAKPLFIRFSRDIANPKLKIRLMSLLMVSGMVIGMTFYGMAVNGRIGPDLTQHYLRGIALNFIVALPLQLFIVSPIVRKVSNQFSSITRSVR